MARVFAILQATTNASRVAAKAAGCTHAIIDASWAELQPSATGTIDATVMARVQADLAHCASIGIKPILSINLHYCPAWALAAIEPFKDQAGFEYLETSTSNGKAVRNWMWTSIGRSYVSDLVTRFAGALTSSEIASIVGARLGGGWYGELHYAEKYTGSSAGTYAWQGFGASMQTGVGLASDQVVCPNPGYIPYTGTDAQDSQWLNWYLNGITTWAVWQIALFKSVGFTNNLYILLPGYGVRSNQIRTSAGYKQAAALGEDHIRLMGAIMHEPSAWPYSTWMNTADGFAGGVADSDKSAWKSVYEKSLVRGKHYNLVGENTGGESNAGMDTIFAGALGSASYSGYPGAPSLGYYYKGMIWLSYADLLAGGSKATLAHYATKISAV